MESIANNVEKASLYGASKTAMQLLRSIVLSILFSQSLKDIGPVSIKAHFDLVSFKKLMIFIPSVIIFPNQIM